MHFPKFWTMATWSGTDVNGNDLSREAWGWSDLSPEDAQKTAMERARRFAETFVAGAPSRHYGYPDRPLREPVLRNLSSGSDGAQAVITRNSYGCDVLNTDRIVFIDVDLPDLPRPAGSGLFGWLFGKSKATPPDDPRIAVEAEKIRRLEDWQRGHPELGFRVYRTAAGLRYLLTSALASPDDPLIAAAMDATGADPDYRRLCRVQKSFRARLTPKPWRCGAPRPPHRFPFADARQTAAMERWLANYQNTAAGHATCLHLLTVGVASVAAAIAPVLAEHDRLTRADVALPLA
jgi:hypothetical protein